MLSFPSSFQRERVYAYGTEINEHFSFSQWTLLNDVLVSEYLQKFCQTQDICATAVENISVVLTLIIA